MSEKYKPEQSKGTAMLRDALVAGGIALTAAVIIEGGQTPEQPDHSIVKIDKDQTNTPEAEQKLLTYTVKQGDSVTEIVSKVYGADDGENIFNNDYYAEEVAAVETNVPEGQLLQPGQVLELPADITQHTESPSQ